MDDREEAFAIAKKAIDFAPRTMGKLEDPEELADAKTIIELMRENVDLWNEIIEDEEAAMREDNDGPTANAQANAERLVKVNE